MHLLSRSAVSSSLIFYRCTAAGSESIEQVILQRASFPGDGSRFDALAHALRPGCTITGVGTVTEDLSLLLRSATLRRVVCTGLAEGVPLLRRLVASTGIGEEELAAALDCEAQEAGRLRTLAAEDAYGYKKAVARHVRLLAGLPPEERTPAERPQLISRRTMDALLLGEVLCAPAPAVEALAADAGADIDLGELEPLAGLPEGWADAACAHATKSMATRGQYATEKKGPQIRALLSVLAADLAPLMARPGCTVVDIGGGRGDLALCVAAAYPHARVLVVDVNHSSLAAGAARSEAAGLRNVRFLLGNAAVGAAEGSGLPSVLSDALCGRQPDLFLGLHVCGGLTDTVLALAASCSSALLVVPCCFMKNGGLPHAAAWVPLLPTHILRGEGADVRAEWRGSMVKLAEASDRGFALRAMTAINALRLRALGRVWTAAGGREGTLRLLSFRESASLKNLVLLASP